MLKTFVSGIKMYLDKVVNQLRNEVGWKSETTEQLFSETATTVASELSDEGVATLSYTGLITADTIKVTFDGVEYICEKHIGTTDNVYLYGGVDDFTEYPFYIISEQHDGYPSINEIHTSTSGTYTVSASTETVTYTDAFKQGVAKNSTFYVDFDGDDIENLTVNRTVSEIQDAYNSGATIIGRYFESVYFLSLNFENTSFAFYNVSLSDDGIMYLTHISVVDEFGVTVVYGRIASCEFTLEQSGDA